MDIKELQKICTYDTVILTKHCKNRCFERDIKADDIINAIMNGEIIEEYSDDKPFPSCLVLGISVSNKYLHVVVSTDGEYIYVVTAYYPDILKWESDYKNRKKV